MAHLTIRFNTFLESILRVPPIFVLDEIFKSGFTFPFSLWTATSDNSTNFPNYAVDNIKEGGDGGHIFYALIFFTIFKYIVSCVGKLYDYIIKEYIII